MGNAFMLYVILMIIALIPFAFFFAWRWFFKVSNGNLFSFYSSGLLLVLFVVVSFYLFNSPMFDKISDTSNFKDF